VHLIKKNLNEDISFDDSQLSEEALMDDVEDDSNKYEDV
jgi:hypothetical protein